MKTAATEVLKVPLAGVNVHTGSFAQRLNHGMGARALTFGDHIFFARGEYRPETSAGAGLVAHELAHVAQQRTAGRTLQPKFRIGAFPLPLSSKGLDALQTLGVEKEVMDVIREMNESQDSHSLTSLVAILSNRSDAGFRAGLVETVEAIRTKKKGQGLNLATPFGMTGAWVPSEQVRKGESSEFRDPNAPMRSDFSLEPNEMRGRTAAAKIQELLDTTTSPAPARIDCGTAVSLAVYYTLVERLGAEAFNKLFYNNEDLVRLINPKALVGPFIKKEALGATGAAAVAELRPGDIVYFRNVPQYAECLKKFGQSGVWAGEWATYMGDKKFVGFGISDQFEYSTIEAKLHGAAVKLCGSEYTGNQQDVPGLRDPDGKAYAFRLDMEKLWKLMATNL